MVKVLDSQSRDLVQNHWVVPGSMQPFILPSSIKWVPVITGNLVLESKLHPCSGYVSFFLKFRCGLLCLCLSEGIIKRAEPYRCGICLVSRILWYKNSARISLLKEWYDYDIWYSPVTFSIILFTSIHSTVPVKAAYFYWKNLWHRVLEANKK